MATPFLLPAARASPRQALQAHAEESASAGFSSRHGNESQVSPGKKLSRLAKGQAHEQPPPGMGVGVPGSQHSTETPPPGVDAQELQPGLAWPQEVISSAAGKCRHSLRV